MIQKPHFDSLPNGVGDNGTHIIVWHWYNSSSGASIVLQRHMYMYTHANSSSIVRRLYGMLSSNMYSVDVCEWDGVFCLINVCATVEAMTTMEIR